MDLDLVVAAYIVQDKRVILVKHKKLGLWLPVGGHIEKDETPDDALRREVGEELQIRGRPLEIRFLQYPQPRQFNQGTFALPFHVERHPIGDEHYHFCFSYICNPTPRIKTSIEYNREELDGVRWFTNGELLGQEIQEAIRITGLEALNLASRL